MEFMGKTLPANFAAMSSADKVAVLIALKALPANWGSFTPAQKIAFYNINQVKPSDLRTVGVSDADLAWMQRNGYTVTEMNFLPIALAVAAYFFLGA